MQKTKKPATKKQLKLTRMTLSMFSLEWKKTIDFFKERDAYRLKLRGWIDRFGFANLPPAVLRTVPTDRKVLYEVKWFLQLGVWLKIILLTWHNAQNELIKEAVNG